MGGEQAAKGLVSSTSLRQFMATCLSASNVLNSDSFRGGAEAMDISFLAQLDRTKSTSGKKVKGAGSSLRALSLYRKSWLVL